MFANATLVSKKCQVVEFQYIRSLGCILNGLFINYSEYPYSKNYPSRQGKFKKFKINSLKFYTGHWTRVVKSANNTPQQTQHVPHRAAL